MKKSKSNIILITILIVGLSLLLYPTVSDYWNSFHQSYAIAKYSEQVSNLSEDKYQEHLANAMEYNRVLAKKGNNFFPSDEEKASYNALLNIDKTGLMGIVEIPSIKVELPIYHGTEEKVLQHAIGHLDWSSLPVGGTTTHCVLSGHRGLPSAKLFTNLDKLVEGDFFVLRILNEKLTYQVDQIKIVEPEEVEDLKIVEGEDYCTLFTCTPYGVNTHRLLVRGKRVDNVIEENSIYVAADGIQIEPLLVAVILATPILLVMVICILLPKPSKKEKRERKNEKA